MTQPDGEKVAEAVAGVVDKLVLDAHDGGSGERFDWTRVPDAVKQKAFLAGGLNPDNLTDALRVGCAGLDLNSGFEDPNGHKDAGALRRGFDTIGNYHD